MSWINLKIKKPKKSGHYYVSGYNGYSDVIDNNITSFSYYYSKEDCFWHDGDLENLNGVVVIFWMERPEPPVIKKLLTEKTKNIFNFKNS